MNKGIAEQLTVRDQGGANLPSEDSVSDQKNPRVFQTIRTCLSLTKEILPSALYEGRKGRDGCEIIWTDRPESNQEDFFFF